jgi:phosphoesterase RecJ-like protein
MDVKVSRREATCLYTGMVTDTGRFHFPATSPRTLEVASRLLETGFKFSRINDLLYATKAFEGLKVLGRALESMELKAGGKLAVLTLKASDFKHFGARAEHSENVINYGMMPPGVKAAVMFREEEGRNSVTFRSRGHLDVSVVAKAFGGGGHRNASGCRIKGPLPVVREKVLAVLTRLLA